MATRKTTVRKRKFADPLEPPVVFQYRGMAFIKDSKGASMVDAFAIADLIINNELPLTGVIFVVNESPVPRK